MPFKEEAAVGEFMKKIALIIILFPGLCLSESYLDQRVREYKESQKMTLAPFPYYFTPLGKTKSEIVDVNGVPTIIFYSETQNSAMFMPVEEYLQKIKADREFKGPIVVRVNPLKFVIYFAGKVSVKNILPGGEDVWNKLYNIVDIPPIPPSDENGNGGWRPDDDSDRWKF